jgi:hypothetical protein
MGMILNAMRHPRCVCRRSGKRWLMLKTKHRPLPGSAMFQSYQPGFKVVKR